MIRLVVLFCLVNLCSTNEHWFVFDQNQFPAFQTRLVSLISSANQRNLSISFSSYERSIQIDFQTNNSIEQTVKLNVERADFLYNTYNHLIFFAIRQENQFETYVNCKLIDSYLLYSTNENSSFEIENLAEGIQHFQMTIEEIFEKFSCKQTPSVIVKDNQTATIGKPLIRKMQHVIEKVQKRKQRSKRHQTSPGLTSDSLTIVYKPNIDSNRIIVNISQYAFSIHYYQNEHLFYIQFNNENRTQIILYADKTTDVSSTSQENQTSNTILFLHITPLMITCYVNCELTDQEFIIDSVYLQNIIRESMINQQTVQFNRQSTLVLFNKSIEQVATNFFCLKLDKKYEDLLPDKYALRKFANALDILVNSLDTHVEQTTTTTPPNISAINIYSINGFGSLKAPSFNNGMNTIPSETVEYDHTCSNDNDCYSNLSFLKCISGYCRCPTRSFWSKNSRRCLICQDLSIGNRCFRLSNHKSTWHESNDYCQDENINNEQQLYSMKLASNLNRTDIQLLKQSLLQDDNAEQLDYFYWIGATSHFNTQKIHKKIRRHIPTTIFRWYDNGDTAQLNQADIWCSQKEQMNIGSINNNELCVSLTSCGLYADNCQRNYRFLCEAI